MAADLRPALMGGLGPLGPEQLWSLVFDLDSGPQACVEDPGVSEAEPP